MRGTLIPGQLMGRPGMAVLALTVTLASLAGSAAAQPAQGSARELAVHAGSGWGQLWDDETNLGRGVPLAGGASVTLANRVRLGATVDWLRHTRDLGALRVDGDAVGVFAQAAYLFGTPAARVRPLAGAGLGVLRATGRSAFDFGTRVIDYASTEPAWELMGGVRIRLTERLALRPEYRWRATFGEAGRPGGMEPPFIGMQALAHIDVALR